MKKFEEGIFSDLRNLKPGVDASLEEPKVSFFVPLLFWSDFFVFVPGTVGFPSSPRRASGRFWKRVAFGLFLAVRWFFFTLVREQVGRKRWDEWVGGSKQGHIYAFLLFLRKKERIHSCHPTSPPWLPAQNRNYVYSGGLGYAFEEVSINRLRLFSSFTLLIPPPFFFSFSPSTRIDSWSIFSLEPFPRSLVQISMYSNPEETKSILLVRAVFFPHPPYFYNPFNAFILFLGSQYHTTAFSWMP